MTLKKSSTFRLHRPNETNAAGGNPEPGHRLESGNRTGQRSRPATDLRGNLGHGQTAGRRPTQDDRNRDGGGPGIGRRGNELVDGVHELQMVNRGGPIRVRRKVDRLDRIDWMTFVTSPVPTARVAKSIGIEIVTVFHL
jgi:hypothetical protein